MYKMEPLDKSIRNKLEHVVEEARNITESAARAALEQLGVGEAMPFTHLTEQERKLRRKLRAHGRQLGDIRNSIGEQEIGRLVEEVAYEHWHRMLFARFLAENNLLMYPDPENPVAVTLEECEDLASDEGAKNGWELAARFATHMLPQIFRPDSPVFQIVLPPEYQHRLARLVVELPKEVFSASDSLGWVYQFWQTKKKDKINASEVKIAARELPALTQLFTEPYMVSFLLDNSLGAWWSTRKLTEADLKNIASEDELRAKAAIPGMSLKYLRFVRENDESWTPAAGTFDDWPEHLNDFKVLDPCCGSGHFLIAAFLMLVPIRMELEGLSASDAVDAVLSENIHGLELDQRCVELAVFALALTAWRYPRAGGYRPLPELNVACSGLAVSMSKEEWKKFALGKQNLRLALDWMYDFFKDAPLFGSLLKPERTYATKIVHWDELSQTLEQALLKEKSEERLEATAVAHGLTKAAMLMAKHYHWIITNVPYLSRGRQIEKLRDFCVLHYPKAKNDLATVFLDRCLEFCVEGGTCSIVLPQNWLFLTSYRKFRENLLKYETWRLIARLGPGAFETISGEVVKAILISLSRGNQNNKGEGLLDKSDPVRLIRSLDVSAQCTAIKKAAGLKTSGIKSIEQAKQLENPDARVALEDQNNLDFLLKFASGLAGIQTGDYPRFGRNFWEINCDNNWEYQQTTTTKTRNFSGLSNVLFWEQGTGEFIAFVKERLGENIGAWIRGIEAYGHDGVMVNSMGKLRVSRFGRKLFDNNVALIFPKSLSYLSAIWCFCSSSGYDEAVRRIDQKMNVTNATLVKVPFDLNHWIKVALEKYPNGLPKPYTDDPTQWIFHGHPTQSDQPLQVAVVRLLGYRWPAELDSTIELSDEARTWVKKSELLMPYADEDGILCIPPVRGESSGADRLLNLLAAAYGNEWSNNKLTQLLKQVNHLGKTLESWLGDKCFTQHCKLFHHRPFIWHIWDGLRDGFAALVNYHKLDTKLLESLIYVYLGDWIIRQKRDKANGVDGAEEKLVAAENLKKGLELILEGKAPYDIFVRWRPIEKQPIGWAPDLNDGVRLNIRPFLAVPDVGRKGAGVLRDKPNINWNKDRGKDVKSAPWYNLGLQYGGREGDRINDHHLSLAEKRAAREAKKMETR